MFHPLSNHLFNGGPVKIKVAIHECAGHARCAAVAPDVFRLNDDGYNDTPEMTVDDALSGQASRGMRACPEKIITIEED